MATEKKAKKSNKARSKSSPGKKAKPQASKKASAHNSACQDEPALTTEEVQDFKQALLKKRAELLGDVDHMAGGALDNNRRESAGDLSSMPIHMADIGTDNYEQEFTLGLIESDRKMLHEIDRALIKVEKGIYGICEGTGRQINRARLEARPEALYCIDFARKIEQGLVSPPVLDAQNNPIEVTE